MLSAARLQLSALGTEESEFCYSHSLQRELQRRDQHTEAVFDTPPEVDRRSFLKILGRARNLPDAGAKIHALCQHLIIEDEVVGILEQRELEDFPAEGTNRYDTRIA